MAEQRYQLTRLYARLEMSLPRQDQHQMSGALITLKHTPVKGTRYSGAPYTRLLHPVRTALVLREEVGVLQVGVLIAALFHHCAEAIPTDRVEGSCTIMYPDACGPLRVLAAFMGRGPSEENPFADLSRLAKADEVVKLVALADQLDWVRQAAQGASESQRRQVVEEACAVFGAACPRLSDRRVAARFRELLAQALEAPLSAEPRPAIPDAPGAGSSASPAGGDAPAGTWHVRGLDTFDGEPYPVEGDEGYVTEGLALEAANRAFSDIWRHPAPNGGWAEDRVYIIRPDGTWYEFLG